ncbi:MAG: 2TM domain-containing protein [Proteobacteria bacterium]|nr:2TM domain-containing protein [Pseudomonadota bacterium]
MHNPLQDQGFKFHLIAYVIVNAILIAVNLMNPAHIWFFWPLLGWGIGLAAHGYAASKALGRPKRPIPRMSR